MVDPRTFEKHRQEMERFRTITSAPQSTSQFRSSIGSPVDVGSSSTSKRRRKQEEEEEEEDQDSSNSSYSNGDESNQTDYQELINIPTKRKRYPKFRQTELIPDDENLNNDSDDNSDGSDDNGDGLNDNGGGSDDNDGNGDDNKDFDNNESYTDDDDRGFSDDDVPIEQFTAPILMILIMNQMMNIPMRTSNSMILGYYYGFLSIRQDFVFQMLP